MQEDLSRLVRLQELMLSSDALGEKVAAIPAEVARLEKELLAAQAEIEKETASLQELLKERRRLEMDLMGVETRIQKYQGQLMEVKTNKEYQAVLHEIEQVRKERAALDERILIDMEEAEKGNAAARVLQERLTERRRETEAGKRALDEKAAALRREKETVDAERHALQASVPQAVLDPFLKIARQRRGLGIVAVREERCAGCHVRVMPKLVQEVRRATGLITCNSCMRILYVPDDAAIPGAGPDPGQAAPPDAGGPPAS